MNVLAEKIKEVMLSVIPITIIVLILNFTVTPFETEVLIRFLIGALLIIIGMSIFLFGIDIGIVPMGTLTGNHLTKSNKLWVMIAGGLILGFFISIAEPDLQVLAGQVGLVTGGAVSKSVILIVVSLGVAACLALGLIRIIYNTPLSLLLTGIYGIIFILSFFVTPEFLAISFDASGSTTGSLTVPFMLSLALGVSSLKKNSRESEEDSFGLMGITSAGAIVAVMLMSALLPSKEITGVLSYPHSGETALLFPFIRQIPIVLTEVVAALLPLLVIFLFFNWKFFKLSLRAFRKISKGFIYTFIGLVIFLIGVNAGFMELGNALGRSLASLDNKSILIGVSFLLGLVTILAEPAVYVLTSQIENVTSGSVKRSAVLFALCTGVGVAVALAILKILIPEIKLWHYLLPGYLISIAMSYFVSELFVGIAFDSGGVASGPMAATFILAFAQGAADATESANVLIDGFGVITMISMMPLIALQILGFIYHLKSKKENLGNGTNE